MLSQGQIGSLKEGILYYLYHFDSIFTLTFSSKILKSPPPELCHHHIICIAILPAKDFGLSQ